ncbi:MAG: DegQ family serine endoprotease [Parvibaculales bacterium]
MKPLLSIFVFFVFTCDLLAAPLAPESFAPLAEELSPAVVNIYTTQTIETGNARIGVIPSPFEQFFDQFQGRRPNSEPRKREVSSLGSGFIIEASGYVVTNNHVIDKADKINVKLSSGEEYKAKIIGRDSKTDLALLKIERKKPFPFVEFGNSDSSNIGDWVIAIGNPFGLGGTVTAGIISAINRDINAGPYDSFIQTDASINKGNSGGPLFNMQGKVIGVNSAIYSPTGGSVGVGFSIPSDLAMSVLTQLREFGQTRRGWLGVVIQEVTEELSESLGMDEPLGALVAEVIDDSPAEKAGLEAGDVILKFDGQDIPKLRDLPRIVAETKIDKKVRVEILRRGKKKNLSVKIGLLDEGEENEPILSKGEEGDKEKTALGMTLKNLTKTLRQQFRLEEDVKGVLITNVKTDSQAADANIRAGDVLVQINYEAVKKPADVSAHIRKAKGKGRKSVLILLQSRGGLRFVAVKLKKDEDE